MAPKKSRVPLVEIDLNVDWTPSEIDNGDEQQEEAEIHFSDLNVDAEDLGFKTNFLK